MDRKIKIKRGKNRASQKSVGKLRSQSGISKVGKIHVHPKLRDKEKLAFYSSSSLENEHHVFGNYLQPFSQDLLYDENSPTSVFVTLPTPLPLGNTEHEVTREHISEKIDKLSSDLANKEDLLKAKDDIIKKIESESIQTQKVLKDEIFELKESLIRYLPHKITFRISTYFVSLFLFAFFADMLGVQIIKPFWNILGMSVSGGFLLMAYFFFLDWQKSNANG